MNLSQVLLSLLLPVGIQLWSSAFKTQGSKFAGEWGATKACHALRGGPYRWQRTNRGHKDRKKTNVGSWWRCPRGLSCVPPKALQPPCTLRPAARSGPLRQPAQVGISLQGWRPSSAPQGASVSCLLWKPVPTPALPEAALTLETTLSALSLPHGRRWGGWGAGVIKQPLWPCCRPFWVSMCLSDSSVFYKPAFQVLSFCLDSVILLNSTFIKRPFWRKPTADSYWYIAQTNSIVKQLSSN